MNDEHQSVEPGELIRHTFPGIVGEWVSAAEHTHYISKLKSQVTTAERHLSSLRDELKFADAALQQTRKQISKLEDSVRSIPIRVT
jgi:predicted  nucleic acid-binding Zn-ribbon protein